MNVHDNDTINKVSSWQIHFNYVTWHLGPVLNINIDTWIRTTIEFRSQLIGQNSLTISQYCGYFTAKFNMDPDGNMAYRIDANKLNGVIGAHIGLKDGTGLPPVFNSYIEVNGKSEIPTGEVNGQLSMGVITSTDLSGPLSGKTVTDLTNIVKNDSVYVVVRTQAHGNGKYKES